METRNQMAGFALLFVYSSLFSMLNMFIALDTINTSTPISDGETLVSAGQSFVLGFFSPTNSTTSRYLGLWYKKSPQTILWVANRRVPLSNNLSTLTITGHGILGIHNSTNNVVWSSNTSRSTAQNPIAQLLETGNFVVREEHDNNPDNFLWQSFDYPCDNLLPGMKLGSNLVTGLNRFLTCWEGTDDPTEGQFSFGIDLQGYPQIVVKKGSRIQYRIGSWNGLYFTGLPGMKQNPSNTFEFVLNKNEVYYKFELKNSSVFSRLILYTSGVFQGFSWNDQTNDWTATSTARVDLCESYAFCGENAFCDANRSPICVCLDGFKPKSQSDWNMGSWTGGCVRRIALNCSDKDGFQTYTGFKLPDTSNSLFDNRISLEECKVLCLQNCSCFAYASLDIRFRGSGSGCLRWFGALSDARTLADGEQDIYVRLAAAELARIEKKQANNKKMHAAVFASCVIVGTSMLILGMIFCIRRRRNLRKKDDGEDRKEDMDLPIFHFSTIQHATDNFSGRKKLGEGGFGPVYKGTLIEGQEIAVKRLSKSSGQGLIEFKNEVILISKLQHRNLVKLLGCCIHEDEKMLIYEYMPNKSLDTFIFDPTRSKILDWSKRVHIIGGIARGLLYLHQDSRLRIIHRDIKASNILLDNDLNPKISDFGLARMFDANQTEANTTRVVGTYGYMSPEYALDGHFSVKSDVFSFGVLVLEIVSGKKNRGFFQPDNELNLLGYAWMLLVDGKPSNLIDNCLAESCTPSEAFRCIHVALLCVQQRPEDRPDMSSVVLMLGSENPLPQPQQPGFSMGIHPHGKDNSQSKHDSVSANEVTVTLLEAR